MTKHEIAAVKTYRDRLHRERCRITCSCGKSFSGFNNRSIYSFNNHKETSK